MPSSPPRRHFLPWDAPWLAQAARWLADAWRGPDPLDLSTTLVVVPTRQSGRRLREALAELAAREGAAVFPPRTHTPDTLLDLAAAAPDVASRLEARMAWAAVLCAAPVSAIREVVPLPPPRRDFAWAWRLAETLVRLQDQLAEAGLDFAAVPDRAGAAFPEGARWAQLAELEAAQRARLAEFGRREPHAVRRDFARHPALPDGITRVALLACPDPLPLALEVLAGWSRQVPVEVVTFAPPSETAAFDSWGRPEPEVWARRTLNLPDLARRVKVCADPAAEAERAAAVARAYPEPDGLVALGVADPEVMPLLAAALARAGLPAFNPEGTPWGRGSLHGLLTALAALVREPSFEAVASLARCPDILAALAARLGPAFPAARFLEVLDRLWSQHLPADLGAARAHATDPLLQSALAFLAELEAALRGARPAEFAEEALRLVFRGRRFDPALPGDADRIAEAEAWRGVVRECRSAAGMLPELGTADWWDVAVRLFADLRRPAVKPVGALELQGWLELLWEDAPHLVVAGCNDGLVPDAVVGDAYLPESLRVALGLRTNSDRFARDAYLLTAVAACREGAGRLDVLLARESSQGDALRPSRLLLRCPDAELPERVKLLFRPVPAPPAALPWTRAWPLTPRRVPPPAKVPVTGLRRWLECPFRFYLAQVLRMEPVDPEKSELDALDFGTLCHSALEAMAREPRLRDCVDETEIRDFLLGSLEDLARARFGGSQALPLVVQLESARQRLAQVARVQAGLRSEGWVVERVEHDFVLAAGGLEIRGRIDRIDRHEGSGAWRILDYKTTDAAPSPMATHLRSARAQDAARPAWVKAPGGAREQVWTDLQLPVYLRAMAAELPAGASLSCGYLNLPKAATATAVSLWSDLTPELLASAHACTDGVAAAIVAGEFWPPTEMDPERDAFAALFHRGERESIRWEAAP